jgi:hypothetical protein
MLFAHNLSQNGTEEQKLKYLPGAVQGKPAAMWCHAKNIRMIAVLCIIRSIYRWYGNE